MCRGWTGLEHKQSSQSPILLQTQGTAHLFRYTSNEEPTPFLSGALVCMQKQVDVGGFAAVQTQQG